MHRLLFTSDLLHRWRSFFDSVDQRYKWRFEIRYTNAVSATLTGYNGAAFTYPSFSGLVIVDAGLCQFSRFILTVTAPSGQVRECIFVNPNCCCEPYRRPDPNEYRVPMSRGVNRLQPSMLVTITGVRQAGNTLPDCGWPGFFNRSFFASVPYGARFIRVTTMHSQSTLSNKHRTIYSHA